MFVGTQIHTKICVNWKELYTEQTAVEQCNSRLKGYLVVNNLHVREIQKITAAVYLNAIVLLASASEVYIAIAIISLGRDACLITLFAALYDMLVVVPFISSEVICKNGVKELHAMTMKRSRVHAKIRSSP